MKHDCAGDPSDCRENSARGCSCWPPKIVTAKEIKILLEGDRRRAGMLQRIIYRLFGVKRRKTDNGVKI